MGNDPVKRLTEYYNKLTPKQKQQLDEQVKRLAEIRSQLFGTPRDWSDEHPTLQEDDDDVQAD